MAIPSRGMQQTFELRDVVKRYKNTQSILVPRSNSVIDNMHVPGIPSQSYLHLQLPRLLQSEVHDRTFNTKQPKCPFFVWLFLHFGSLENLEMERLGLTTLPNYYKIHPQHADYAQRFRGHYHMLVRNPRRARS